MPSASIGTGTGRSPAARAAASAPGYVGDSTRTGLPGAARALKSIDSAPCPPPVTRTSSGPTSPPAARAKTARSGARPAAGARSQASGRRAARASAALSARSGRSEGCR
ncbi:hypothetical protein SNARM312S_01824 [Streptomyces narbonensis]